MDIFEINSQAQFNEVALSIFKCQSENNKIYKEYINLLSIDTSKINDISQIPFLPISFFTYNEVLY